MKLISWNRPDYSPAERPADEDFNRLLSAFWGELNLPSAGYAPRLDVRENADEVLLQVDLPGVDRQAVSLSLNQGVLTLQGRRPAEHAEAAEGWTRVERHWGAFERQVRLGEGYDASRVKAELKDGVLSVRVPKLEAAKPRSIEIQ